ncbi:MAG: peptide deformylase [Acidaminobacteraceae bacterium]
MFLDGRFHKQNGKFTGWTSQIIQHEIGHCNGIII